MEFEIVFDELPELIKALCFALPIGALVGFACWCVKKIIVSFKKFF